MSAQIRTIEAWDSVAHPHIAVVGEHVVRRQRAAGRVLSRLGSAAGAEIVTIRQHLSAVEIERQLQRALAELSRRFKDHDENGESASAPLVIVLEDFEAVDVVLQQAGIRGRVHDYLEDLISLGPGEDIHLVITAAAAQFAFSSPHQELAHLFVGALDHRSAVLLGKDRTRYPDIDAHHGWLFAPDVEPVIVRLQDEESGR